MASLIPRWGLALALVFAFAKPAAADSAKSSLRTESDEELWRAPGFRLGLGLLYGQLAGREGAPSGRLFGPILRVGVRLDRDWSLMSTFQYASASAEDGLRGLRFAGTVEPTLHLSDQVSVALGLGFGGIVEDEYSRVAPEPRPFDLETSYTFPDAGTPLRSCSGIGVAALARIDWMMMLGDSSKMGAALQVNGQWTRCTDDASDFNDNTGELLVVQQYWPHVGGAVSWVVLWR